MVWEGFEGLAVRDSLVRVVEDSLVGPMGPDDDDGAGDAGLPLPAWAMCLCLECAGYLPGRDERGENGWCARVEMRVEGFCDVVRQTKI